MSSVFNKVEQAVKDLKKKNKNKKLLLLRLILDKLHDSSYSHYIIDYISNEYSDKIPKKDIVAWKQYISRRDSVRQNDPTGFLGTYGNKVRFNKIAYLTGEPRSVLNQKEIDAFGLYLKKDSGRDSNVSCLQDIS